MSIKMGILGQSGFMERSDKRVQTKILRRGSLVVDKSIDLVSLPVSSECVTSVLRASYTRVIHARSKTPGSENVSLIYIASYKVYHNTTAVT